MSNLPQVTIYTDGGAVPNPGTGGYGILLIYPDQTQTPLSDGERDTTNNRMELTAACVALEALTTPHEVILYTDSQYVQKGITEWIQNWVRKNWKDVKNVDLWKRLYNATQRHEITWKWVKGHAGNVYNERVDQMATAAREAIEGTTKKETLAALSQPVAADAAPTPAYDYVIYTGVQLNKANKSGTWASITEAPQAQTHHQDGNGIKNTTEYELALVAVCVALEELPTGGSVLLHTPNDFVYKGATMWIKGWRKNGWKNSKGEIIAHHEHWLRLDALMQARTIKWEQQTHHAADALASDYFKQTFN